MGTGGYLFMDSIIDYLEDEFQLSAIEKAKLKYSIDVLFADITKILILLVISAFLGKTKEYAFSVLVLSTIRPYTGGLHFKTYTGCLSFTGLFFTATIILNSRVSLNNLAPYFFVFSFITIFLLAPIISKNRPSYSNKKKLQFKILSLVIVSIHYIAYIMVNNHYLSLSVWIILLQSIQLILGKGVEIYEKNKKYNETVS